MADWYGTTRSNYVKVKDAEAFKEYVNLFTAECIAYSGRADEGVVMLAFLSTADDGSIPYAYFTDDEEAKEFSDKLYDLIGETFEGFEECSEGYSIIEAIHYFLEDGEVMVVESVGAEKMRYMTAEAYLIHSSGESEYVDLDEVAMKMAESRWGIKPTSCSY